jgi:osmoprotectant transport system ATP-binding protein
MIRLENLTKIFETREGRAVAADNVCMNVREGEVCVLLGPSGCGKTTTLKMINRLIPPTSGKVFINDQDTTGYDTITLRRGIGYVIQQIGLFPNMTVAENIGVVPQMLGWDKRRIEKRVAELLEMVTLDPAVFMTRFPKELSGGQQQRVGVARALAADPPVLLMDEPFGAIDPINRAVIQDEFLKMQKKLGKTILFVSHDIDEAVKMGDKVALFREGRLEQFDSPDNFLAHPANDFVADFVGRDRTLKRLPLACAADVLDSDAPRVTAGDTLDTAARIMRESGHRNLAVLDESGEIQGVLTDAMLDQAGGVCGGCCRTPRGRVAASDDLRTVVSLMFAQELNWLPCVDEHDRYVGCITLPGITRFLGQTYRNPGEEG